MIRDTRYVSLCACEQVLTGVEYQRLGKEEEQPLDYLHASASLSETLWSKGRMKFYVNIAASLTLSSSFSPFFILFYLFPFFISLFFSTSLFFFKQARTDTSFKPGYSFSCLEFAARRSAISPTLELLGESQVCNVGVSFSNVFQYQRAS